MKNKKILKKLIALVCATTILAGGMTVLPKDSNVANAADVPAGLEGYTRITPEDFGITEETAYRKVSKSFSYSSTDKPDVFFNRAYFDVDLRQSSGKYNERDLFYLGKNVIRIYQNNGTLTIYNMTKTSGTKYDQFNPGLSNTEYFNLKLATDITTNDEGNYVITLQAWANGIKLNLNNAKTITLATDKLTKTAFGTILTTNYVIMIKPPTKETGDMSVSSRLSGYDKITPEHFGIKSETINTYNGASSTQTYSGRTELIDATKAYFEGDISLTSSPEATNGTSIAYLNEWLFRIYKIDNSLTVYSLPNEKAVWQVNLPDFGVTKDTDEYFNLRLATDVADDPNNSSNKNITIQLWINGIYCGDGKKTVSVSNNYLEVADLEIANLCTCLYQEGTIKIKPATPEAPLDTNCPEELANYTRITPVNYGITKEVTNAYTYKRNSNWYNMRYFETDIAFDKAGSPTENSIFYMGRYNLNMYMRSGSYLVIRSNQDTSVGENGALINERVDDVSLGKYFNLKIATKLIKATTSNETYVINIWINNKPVVTDIEITVDAAQVTNVLYSTTNVRIKPPAPECAIQYDDISLYRTAEEKYAPNAPVGYIFAGWYKEQQLTKAYTEADISGSDAWARFVDARLLTIKAQITAGTQKDTPETAIRFVTSVDDLKYGEVGFDISTTEKKYGGSDRIVYTKLTASVDGKENGYTPENLFCPAAEYFKAWIITNIPSTSYDTVFTVTAYWITIDGTRVNGTTAQKAVSQAF